MSSAEHGSLGDRVRKHADAAPRSLAVLATGRAPLTYAKLAAQVDSVGATFADRGIGAYHRVALALPNGPELATAVLSVASHAICAPLDPASTEPEFRAVLEDLQADLLIAPAQSASSARAAAATLGVPCADARWTNALPAGAFELSGIQASIQARAASPGAAVALLLRTSGTTSRPRRVPLSQANLCHAAANVAATLELTPRDRCLSMMPLFHVHGLVGAFFGSLFAGASIVFVPTGTGRFVDALQTFEPSWYTAVPTLHRAILAEVRGSTRPVTHSLRFVRSSSAELSPATARALEETFDVPVIEAYGMTEAAHLIASNRLPPASRRLGSVGRAAGPQIVIIGSAGDFLPAGSVGEIAIRGDNVIERYETNDAVNEEAFHAGWLRTGDAGSLDEEGYLRITGRLKEMINRGGEKVAPREVEEALSEHAAVAECVAFAVPHATLGEDVIAAVVSKPGASVSGESLRQSLFGRLAEARIPSRVLIVAAIPKGPSGKVRRIELAERLRGELYTDYVTPRNALEALIAALFAEVLEVERAGADDNFFVLGGDSLRAGQLASRLQERLGTTVALGTVFRFPTPAELAAEIERTSPALATAARVAETSDRVA